MRRLALSPSNLRIRNFPRSAAICSAAAWSPSTTWSKIKVAVGSRESSDFLIIARTDARTTLGLDEALRRAEAYGKAGADILFVESPESLEEIRVPSGEVSISR